MKLLKQEMLTVLKRILVRLSDVIGGLKVSDVRERDNRYLKNLSMISMLRSRRIDQEHRSLRDESLIYDVYVVRDDGGKRFGPIIIDYMKQNYGEVLEQIQ